MYLIIYNKLFIEAAKILHQDYMNFNLMKTIQVNNINFKYLYIVKRTSKVEFDSMDLSYNRNMRLSRINKLSEEHENKIKKCKC